MPSRTQWLVLLFAAFHLLAIFVACVPINVSPIPALRNLFNPYLLCTGLNQMWDTFAPNPKAANQYLKAVVITAKGNNRIYSFPRMEQLSFFERYREERYRKFAEAVLVTGRSGLWPDIEKSVARRMNSQTDPPDKVILIKFESPIDPKTGATGDDLHAQPTMLSEQFIEPEDLP